MPFTTGNFFIPLTYDGDMDALGHQLVQKIVWEFDQDGNPVAQWPIDQYQATEQDDPDIGGGLDHIAINNGKIYALFSRTWSRLFELSPDGSVRILFDYTASSPDARFLPSQTTFDSEGHIYAVSSRIGVFPVRQGAIYKIDKDSGVLLRRWTYSFGVDHPYDSVWLMDDDKTMLLGNSFADGWEGLLSIDLSSGDDIEAQEFYKIRSPHDGANFGYYFDMEDIAVIDHHVYATTAPSGAGNDYDSLPLQRVEPGVTPQQPFYFSNESVTDHGFFEDEGFSIDCDPDGIGIWVASQSSDFFFAYKFHKDTGEKLKSIGPLPFPHGNSRSGANPTYTTALIFAIAGGSGHHGCGCCVAAPTATGLIVEAIFIN